MILMYIAFYEYRKTSNILYDFLEALLIVI